MSIYADDIIYLSEPEQSIEALNVTEEFGTISGYTLNVNKSEVMIMGGTISVELKDEYTFQWDVERIKYLGINKEFGQLVCKEF